VYKTYNHILYSDKKNPKHMKEYDDNPIGSKHVTLI